jgi:hypothetical protein
VGVTSIPQAQALLGVTYRGAQLNVTRLVEYGILSQLGEEKYGKLFAANAIIALLEDKAPQAANDTLQA